jgi:hypothetical protein
VEPEHLSISVVLERLVSQASFEFKGFVAFSVSHDIEILEAGRRLEREELVAFLFSRV